MTEKSSLLIHKIEITNCGGFIGPHEIELSTKKEQNFTIILGESGIGKSTTFQLIFWCLLGKHFNPKSILSDGESSNMKFLIPFFKGSNFFS